MELNSTHVYVVVIVIYMVDLFCFDSVIIMRFALASTSECVYLLPTTGYSLAPFLRVKQRSRLLKSLLKSQVRAASLVIL